MPVLEESKILRTRALVEMLSDSGENRLEPDVMLKLGNDMLPAHSAFLAQSSGYFKAKFQASFPYHSSTLKMLLDNFAVSGMTMQRKGKKAVVTPNLLQVRVRAKQM